MPKLARRLFALFVSTFVGIVLFELVLWSLPRSWLPHEFRLLDRVYDARGMWQEMMTGDDYLGYKLKPNVDLMFPSEGRQIRYKTIDYDFGNIGFRDIGTRPPFDAVVVGDSFSLCDDVAAEHCWIKHLNDRTGLSFGTLGVNGYSTLAEERVLERYGMKFKPRLVLLGIHPNDFKDNVNFHDWSKSGTDNLWVWLGARHGRNPFSRTLANYSMLYRMIDGFFRTRGRPIHAYKDDNFDFVFRFDQWWLRVLHDTEDHKGFKLMKESMLRMQQMARSQNAEFMALLFPTKEQIYWDKAKQFADNPNMNVDLPVETVQRFCQQNGIKCCVMNEQLRTLARQGKQLYHRINQHWNDEGNRIGSYEVERCLNEAGILPALKATEEGTVAGLDRR
ncbi:MAG TPA: hypothetical protein VEB21_08965 [Terriglobales bacterium]|nr:hypothetical protein [Terriglobales bacterium]